MDQWIFYFQNNDWFASDFLVSLDTNRLLMILCSLNWNWSTPCHAREVSFLYSCQHHQADLTILFIILIWALFQNKQLALSTLLVR